MKPVEWSRGVPRTKARESKNLIVALDIGTSKIAAIVAELRPGGGYEVIGMGSSRPHQVSPSRARM